MDRKTMVASAFTVAVVIGAATWTAKDPYARAAWRSLLCGPAAPPQARTMDSVDPLEHAHAESRRLTPLQCFIDDEFADGSKPSTKR